MTELSLILFAVAVVVVALYPIHRSRALSLLLGLCLLISLGLAYLCFGQGLEVRQFVHRQQQWADVKVALQSYGGRAFVIKALRARLDHSKHSAYGWYLLAKLYASQGQKKEAEAAFQEAVRLDRGVKPKVQNASG